MHDLNDFFERNLRMGYVKHNVSSNCYECGEETEGFFSSEKKELLLICPNNHETKVPFNFE
jgi:hypothetical protein